MRIAVFGGTGFVGSYLVDALLASGHEPSLLVRPGSESKPQRASECRLVSGELGSIADIAAVLDGCEAAIYNVGILAENPKLGITFEALQYEGVVRLIEAAQKSEVRRLLLMSANGVKAPGTPYQETKFRAEQYAKASGLDVTVFRPSVIFGDPRGLTEIATQLHAQMILPPVPAAGFFSGCRPRQGAVTMSPVHVEDVAQAFVRVLHDRAAVGRTIVLGGPEVLAWSDMLRRIASAAGRGKWILPVPIGLMKFAATLFGWLPFFPVTRDQLTMLAEGNNADPSELAALIGREPQRFEPENLAYLRS